MFLFHLIIVIMFLFYLIIVIMFLMILNLRAQCPETLFPSIVFCVHTASEETTRGLVFPLATGGKLRLIMAAIIAQLTRAKRERAKKKTYETNKCMYELPPFDPHFTES